MIQIEYKDIAPDINEYLHIYSSTCWRYTNPIEKTDLEVSLKNTWYWICAYHQNSLVGIGRLISDGALYALICDLIVLPKFQNQRIGSAVLNKLINKCMDTGLRRIWLFAASDKSKFYEQHGFKIRSQNMPGMQLSTSYQQSKLGK